MTRRPLAVSAAVLLTLSVAACTDNSATSADGDGALSVESTADACEVSAAQAPSGTLTFSVTNSGDDVTEFYLLGEDGLRIISEVENIGPGLTRDLVVQAGPGKYFTACKPGMVGEGIRHAFTVTDSGAEVGPSGAVGEQLAAAEESYVAYVKDQAGTLVAKTEEFAELYTSGDDAAARAAYAPTRVHWERIEPVAESFGDLDPLLDLREADLEAGQEWSGWHYIEKDLWPPASGYTALSQAEREAAAADLVDNTRRLVEQVNAADFSFEAFQIGNGSKELLDEIASGKVTGEEEIWSHTDLWDFQANVDGAYVAFEVLRDVAQTEDPALVETLETRFADLESLLAEQGSYQEGFTSYEDLSDVEVRELAAAVDAVGEPLSNLTATVTDAA
ncbi:MAG: EfeM/EfeO family lipoprotein [Nocardioidaceae bacterium]|jgi:iron uptake system component EfeO|nr:EfeM/EfeO family lipoprotein [Nocardioidaceae bacterium]